MHILRGEKEFNVASNPQNDNNIRYKIFLQTGGRCEDREVEYIPVATTDRGELYVDC